MTPETIKAQFAQARRLLADGQPDKAEPLLKALLLPTGGAAEVLFTLAQVHEAKGDTPAQAAALDDALAQRPDEPALVQAAIRAHTKLDNRDRVLTLLDGVIARAPKEIKPRADKAHYLQQIGELTSADKLLRKLIREAPDQTELYRMWAAGTKVKPKEPLVKQMQRLWRDPRLNDRGKMQLGFALAKAHEDAGATDRVFPCLDAANAAQARMAPYDPTVRETEWLGLRGAQEGADLTPLGVPLPFTPVFVTGMPRSGTTLVEQILGAHPQVTPGGELGHALREAVRLFGPAERMTPLRNLGEGDLARWAEGYARLVRRDTGATSGVVTDKAIQTQLIFGLIARGMPGARILVVHRDPRDMALSMYKNHFEVGRHRYTNRLEDIAQAIKAFRAQVAHWQARMPDRIVEIRYEDLVSDPEAQTRALVAAAGLDWDDACLRFHKGKTRVKTLSLAQVRQPLHGGRRAAWRAFEREMAPFIEAWGDTPWD